MTVGYGLIKGFTVGVELTYGVFADNGEIAPAIMIYLGFIKMGLFFEQNRNS